MTSQFDTLTQINLDDLVSSFGWEKSPFLTAVLHRIFTGSARKFAQHMVNFDTAVGQTDIAEASQKFMQRLYVRDVKVYGREHIPTTGPVLFLSNHPGLTDTMGLFAAIQRTDLKIIALRRPFLASLDNVTRRLLFIDDDSVQRTQAIRQAVTHLRNGGAALTFPAGHIEPDPQVYPGALDSLNDWTDSAGSFIRFAPQAKIVPVLVSGVIWEKTAQHWVTRLKKKREDREKFAAALQLLAMVVYEARPTTTKIQFAKPITLEEVGSTESKAIHQVVTDRMRGLLQTPLEGEGVSAL